MPGCSLCLALHSARDEMIGAVQLRSIVHAEHVESYCTPSNCGFEKTVPVWQEGMVAMVATDTM